ncbi:arabinose-5-phosphate isomerase [Lewinella marina]|uniref:D-arabinose 5-phosphate isomerase n=1 Tax=Neolewinella marina TaxID=438751 RepID=A0A2G0CE15_9BACT|nr:KpsF/GutQ family sugar-phosphate isomerase [Neolewinella marina]NJB87474.1 arabinose-5-phosphate isomerase [Neolewinella marina]PHK98218.1 D-arabinose 5-phosphate isomerase [Neolewinella marina]
MKKSDVVVRTARQTLRIEADALSQLADGIGENFARSVEAIFHSGGRLIVTGVGKTALVAQKIVATLNSTGTPAFFLHAGDAIHGDIGMVQPADVVLVLSRSGETTEIRVLTLLVRNLGNTLIAMTSREDSALARAADYLLLTPFEREADPNELAPTTSTTLQMAMGDAVATALLALRGFTPADFARFHPGGSLGKQLYLRVRDLYPHNQKPVVSPTSSLKETLYEMTGKCLGATAVVDPQTDRLVGVITDGDLRRFLNRDVPLDTATAADMMTPNPKTIPEDELAVQAVARLQEHSISQLIVVDGAAGNYLGFVHLHDFIREGLV